MRNASNRTWNWMSHSGWVSGNFYYDGFSLVGETHLSVGGFSAFTTANGSVRRGTYLVYGYKFRPALIHTTN